MTLEVFASGRGRAAAEEAARQRSGKTFDPLVVDAFLAEAQASSFWETLGSGDLWDAALAWEPESAHRYLPEDALDDVALVFADFADLKSTYTAAHSRATAQLAEAIAREIRLPPDQLAQLRRAALVHDLGLVAVPSRLIEQQAPLSAAEQEQLRLHPLLTERILSRVPVLQPIGSLAAMHHEWLNGTGYPRGLSAPDLPVAARILAVADAFQELAEDRPGRPGSGAAHAVQVIEREAGSRFDRACLEALGRVLGLTSARRVRAYFPAGLTEREIEVVRLLGRGRTNRQIAESLVLTEKTVAHHLDHIYNKMGVSSRTAAVLWAMEQGLLT